ncbi:MAG: phosphatase PAP2 family protein [Gammaproteobacteria bacterium]|nr:phosphatase PAP2 family protein [Gammaproteobacteria bacterium]
MHHHHYYAIVDYLKVHPVLGLLLTFVIAAAECIPFVGTVIPGSVTMTGVGILVGSGIMSLWLALFAAVAGALAGDSFGLAIGYYYQDRLDAVWPFRKYPHWLDRGRTFMSKHGGKSIFIGRFASPIRAMVPLVAGMLRISLVKFYAVDFLSAIGWAILYMLPGFLLGKASLEIPPELATKVIILALLILIIIWLVSWSVYLVSRWFYQHSSATATDLWLAMQKRRATHPLCWLLRHGEHNEGQFGRAALFIVVLILFFIVATHVAISGELIHWNEAVYHLFRGLSEVILRKIFIVLSMLGQDDVILPTVIPLVIWFAWRKQWRIAWHYLALVVISGGAVWLSKFFVSAERPPGILDASLLSSSFPSGHTTFAIVIYGFIGYLLTTIWPQWRKLIYWCAAALCAIVILSRLYLSLHWFTDIIGGILLGLCCLLPIVISYRRRRHTEFSPLALMIIFIVTIAFTSWGHLERHYKGMVHDYRPVWPNYQLGQSDWWQHRHAETIPLYRTTRLGRPAQVLNVQWAGELEPIAVTLTAAHWQLLPVHHIVTLFNVTTEKGQGSQSIAIAERLERDHLPTLIAIKTLENGKRALLFLWPANISLTPGSQPLWVGTLYYKDGHHHFFHELISTEMAEANEALIPALQTYHYRQIAIDDDLLPVRLTNGNKSSYQLLLIKPKVDEQEITDEEAEALVNANTVASK